jgi:hypothetical protein
MLCPMNGLLRRLLCGGCVAASLSAPTYARADEPPSDDGDPMQVEAEPPPPDESMPAPSDQPGEPPPPPPNSAPLPLPNSAPPGPLPDISSGPPPGAAADPTNPATYDPAADTDPAALNDFHDTLAPYGGWVEDPTYGVVWVPSGAVVGSDFAPYVSHGHWGLGAESSWVWVSDFNWGWAPFHYGRWVWIGGRGWSWIPGRVYAPAWVVWRTGYYDDYYVGWAPMPPTWYWRGGVAFGLGFATPAPYVFCSSRYVFSPGVRSYVVPPSRVGVSAPHTRAYVAAAPSVGSASYRAALYTRGPSLVDAHVPASAVPAQRVAPDVRAVNYARPVAAAARSYGPGVPRPAAGQYRQNWAGQGSRPTVRAGAVTRAEVQRPAFQAPQRALPPTEVPRPVPQDRSYARPTPPSVSRSAPTYSAPPTPRAVAPTPRMVAPRAAPAPQFSPSFRSSVPRSGGRTR